MFTAIESTCCNLGRRRHHLFPKATSRQLSERVLTFPSRIQPAPHSEQPPPPPIREEV